MEGGERRRVNNANLTSPDYWIVVEVVKNSAAISVVKDYERFKKMNLQTVAQAANERRAGVKGEGRIAASLVAKTDKEEAVEERWSARWRKRQKRTGRRTKLHKPITESVPAEEKKEDEQQMANFRLF